MTVTEGWCPFQTLTTRERECLALVAQHWRTRQIAQRLSLSTETVDEYVGRAVQKAGVGSRGVAARMYLSCECQSAEAAATRSSAAVAVPAQVGSPLAIGRAAWIGARVVGALAGTALLVSALGQATSALPALADTILLLGRVGVSLALVLALLAFANGRTAERLAVSAYLSAWVLSRSETVGPELASWPPFLAFTDLLLSVVMAALAITCRRPALRIAAALQLVGALAHFAVLSPDWFSRIAYLSIVNLCAYGVLLAILWSGIAVGAQGGRTKGLA